jgi:DNA polymerase-3 subunit epsilon
MSKFDIRELDLCFIDTETTGLDPYINDIIEICIVKTDQKLKIKEKLVTLISPMNSNFDPISLEINQISAIELANAPSFKTCSNGIKNIMDNSIVVGHNIKFDLSFIEQSYKKIHEERPIVHYHAIDTSSIAWPLYVAGKINSVSLSELCEYFGVTNDGSHRAENDVDRLIKVYKKLMSI